MEKGTEMAAYKKGQRYQGVYSPDFTESKVTGLDDNAYYPSREPNVYTANKLGKNSVDLSYIDRDNSVGSGPIGDDRNVSHRPRELD
jgi:hypothetical protein